MPLKLMLERADETFVKDTLRAKQFFATYIRSPKVTIVDRYSDYSYISNRNM